MRFQFLLPVSRKDFSFGFGREIGMAEDSEKKWRECFSSLPHERHEEGGREVGRGRERERECGRGRAREGGWEREREGERESEGE